MWLASSMNQKGFAPIIILFIVLVLGGIVGGMVYSRSKTNQATSVYPQPTTSQSDQTANWKTYANTRYGYSIRYPPEWSLREENTDGTLVMLSKPAGFIEFQNEYAFFLDQGQTLENYLKQTPGFSNLNLVKEVNLNGNTVFIFSGGIEDTTQIFISPAGSFDNRYFSVILKGFTFDEVEPIFSTFRFTDSATTSSSTSKVTQEQALEKVRSLNEVKEYLIQVPNGKVEFDHEDEAANAWVIHVYEVKNGHTATFNWYSVSKETGKMTDNFGKEY